MDRVILHSDCNNFYASVECILHPEYRTIPMAVCGNPDNRHGIILAKNELAKAYGVKTAETIWQAKQKCPDLLLTPPHHKLYHDYSKHLNAIYCSFTDLVEPFGIDESWLDVTGSRMLFGTGEEIAEAIHERVRRELGLTVSVGVSFNKIFAKLGSDYKKPDATTVITRENFRSLLYPLPVSDLLFVGKHTAAFFEKFAIHTIGELAACDRDFLSRHLQKAGEMLWMYANGLEHAPVSRYEDAVNRFPKSVSNQITYPADLCGTDEILPAALALCDQVASRLRQTGAKCQTVRLQIKTPAFTSIQRQCTLAVPTHSAKTMYRCVRELVKSCTNDTTRVRMLGIGGANLVPDSLGTQTSLFCFDEASREEKNHKIDAAMDRVRQKFGTDAISFASLIEPNSDEKPS